MQPEYPIELAGSGVSKSPQQPGVNGAGRMAQTLGQDGGQSFRDAGLKDTARSCSGATEHLTLHLDRAPTPQGPPASAVVAGGGEELAFPDSPCSGGLCCLWCDSVSLRFAFLCDYPI